MNPFVHWALIMLWAGFNASHFIICLVLRPSWQDIWTDIWIPVYCVTTFCFAVNAVVDHDWIGAGINSFFCVFVGWTWWNDRDSRRRRKKLLDRAAGRVKDMGGRLTVVRPSEGGA